MKKNRKQLSTTVRKRLEIQGYTGYTDEELHHFKYGIRFAYLGCGAIVATGLGFQSPVILAIALIIAFLAMFPPYHPLDYVYNLGIRHLLGLPKTPERTNQGRFACTIATVWLGTIIFTFLKGYVMTANILGFMLLTQAFIVATIDFCVPSMIYNFLFGRKPQQVSQV